MTGYTPQDGDMFLSFLRDAGLLFKGLPGRLEAVKEAPSAQVINDIHSRIKNLATHAQLIDLNSLQPVFDVLLHLIDLIDLEGPENLSFYDRHFEYIDQLSCDLVSLFDGWDKKVSGTKGDTGLIFDGSLEPEGLAEIRAFCENTTDPVAPASSGPAAGDQKTLISGFIKEGLSILQILKNQVADSLVNADALYDLQDSVSMLQGNGEVLAEFAGDRFQAEHRFYAVTDILEGMASVLKFQIPYQEKTADGAVHTIERMNEPFNLCIDELEKLFKAFNQADPPQPGPALKELSALFDRIKNAAKPSVKEPDSRVPKPDADVAAPGADDRKKDTTFLPIRLERIEDLGNFIGELIVAQNAFTNIRRLVEEGDPQNTCEFLKTTQDSFHRIISDLDALVMKMRMQKIKTLFNRFPRLVRDLSKTTGKIIDLKFSGEDTEIDNRILSEVTDPMMHLVRNALDHGIEMPEQRKMQGKDPRGLIRFSAMNREGRTIVEIYDDGRGIDPDVLRKKAVEKGLISAEDARTMPDKQARALIFMPGFSTAESVTQISGRGVGMDVVMENIRNVNGTVDIDSRTGEYTTIILSLPLTISVSKGFKIRLGNDAYMVPIDDIVKVTDVGRHTIHRSKEFAFTLVDDKIQPILPVNQLLGYPSPIDKSIDKEPPQVDLVVVKCDQVTAAIAVDEILGIEDIVVKPIPDIDPEVQALYTGCTILSDGGIVLILNMNACFKKGGLV